MYRNDIIKELNRTIALSDRMSNTYKLAAHHVDNSDLKQVLIDTHIKRLAFKKNLQAEIKSLGREVSKPLGIVKSVRSLWRKASAMVLYRNEQTAINRVLKNEKEALATINSILNDKDLPSYVQKILLNYKYDVNQTIARIKNISEAKENEESSVPQNFDPVAA